MSKTHMYLAVGGLAVVGVAAVYYFSKHKAGMPPPSSTGGSTAAGNKASAGQSGRGSNAFDLGIALITTGGSVYDAYAKSNTSQAAVSGRT
jgi:hypothetical protein